MLKRGMSAAFIFCFILSAAHAETAMQPKAKAAIAKRVRKAVTAKKAAPAVKVQQKAAPAASAPVSVIETPAVQEEDIASVKEEMNQAVTDLKNQLETVKQDNSDVKVSGELRFAWQKGMQNVNIKDNFDVTRAYLTFKKKLSGDANVRITLDVSRLTAASTGGVTTTVSPQRLFDFLKYAYVELPLLQPSSTQIIPISVTGKIGLQHNMWIDWVEHIWNNADVMKVFADNEGVMSSSDFGLGLTGKMTLPYLPNDVEYHTVMMNGTGYGAQETNSDKDWGLRLNTDVYTSDMLGTVTVGGYIYARNYLFNTNTSWAQTKKTAGALVALKNDDYGNVYAEYLKGNGQDGYSIGGYLTPMPSVIKLGVLARVDSYDPNNLLGNPVLTNRTLYGIFYNFNKETKVALDVQSSQVGSAATQTIAYMHTDVNSNRNLTRS